MAAGDKEWAQSLVVSTECLMTLFGVGQVTAAEWVKKGMPKVSHGKYNLGECVRWRIQYVANLARGGSDGDLNEERRRLIVEQRRGQEIDNAERLAELLPAEEVKTHMLAAAAIFASQLESLPARVTPRVAVMDDPKLIQRVIADECRSIRVATSEAFAARADRPGDGESDSAPAEKKRGRVGRPASRVADRVTGAGAVAD